jgi:hypothetical protein
LPIIKYPAAPATKDTPAAIANALLKFCGLRISLAKLGTTAWPPNPARTSPIPPNQFASLSSGPKVVGEGWMIDPGAEVLIRPSRRITRTRRNVDIVDKSEGRERRCNGKRVVGRTLR